MERKANGQQAERRGQRRTRTVLMLLLIVGGFNAGLLFSDVICTSLRFQSSILQVFRGRLNPASHIKLTMSSFRLEMPPRPPALAIRSRTFAYLVMGEGDVEDVWLQSHKAANVCVIYLSWLYESGNGREAGVQTYFYPNSTWASGRNKLLHLAKEREVRQAWKFEFFVFWDADARLMLRHNQTLFYNNTHMQASRLHRRLLLRDRPARAGIAFPGDPQMETVSYYNMTCVRSCAFDAACDAYHRTAVDQVLPYPTRFDAESWWMSSETTSYRSAAAFPAFCNTYRRVVLQRDGNDHRLYPGQAMEFADWKQKAIDTFYACIRQHNVTLILWENVQHHGIDRTRITSTSGGCTRQQGGIDYAQHLTEEGQRVRQCTSDN